MHFVGSQTFTTAIVRAVPATLATGITSATLGVPDFERACEQHARYVAALESCGLEVVTLEADDRFPDSVFIEDTAVVTDRCAIISRPGAESRRGEISAVEAALSGLRDNVERVQAPGTLDGGDVLQVGERFFVGLTERTNREGAEQFAEILRGYGYQTLLVDVRRFLHLKTGVSHLGGRDLVVAGELISHDAFENFDKLVVPPEEEYCANCIRVNDRVIVPSGFLETRAEIVDRGYEVVELEISEFRKLDGGLSCLSLRF